MVVWFFSLIFFFFSPLVYRIAFVLLQMKSRQTTLFIYETLGKEKKEVPYLRFDAMCTICNAYININMQRWTEARSDRNSKRDYHARLYTYSMYLSNYMGNAYLINHVAVFEIRRASAWLVWMLLLVFLLWFYSSRPRSAAVSERKVVNFTNGHHGDSATLNRPSLQRHAHFLMLRQRWVLSTSTS